MSPNFQPIIEQFDYNSFSSDDIVKSSRKDTEKHLLLNYPTVYIIRDKGEKNNASYTVYVGETTNIGRRTKQHLNDDIKKNREDWQKLAQSKTANMYVIGHPYFNKSLTLDIENKLMHYLSSVESVGRVNNRRTNQQNDYYTSKHLKSIFSKIWRKLRKFDKNLFPAESLVEDSALFKASPFHKLTEEQLEAKNKIILKIVSNLSQNKDGQFILVEGDAGSGKSVLMSSLLYELFNGEHFNAADNNFSVHLLVNHEQQLVVYQELAKKLGLRNSNNTPVVSKPTSFINSRKNKIEKADIVIIDEAHLLLTQGKQSYRGKNHLKDILATSKIVVTVFDPKQILNTEQYWEEDQILELKHSAALEQNYIYLESQMRIHAELETIRWIRDLLDYGTISPIPTDKQYDLKVFNSPTELFKEIKEKNSNQEKGLSRTIATFDWEYSSSPPKNGGTWNVTIGNFSVPWNLQLPKIKQEKGLSWAEQTQTIDEIGSTFTVQGFDLNYAGVIIGPSVKYRDGKIVYCPDESKNRKATQNRTLSDGSKQKFAEEFLKNELNVLLTRGVNGLYLFAVDSALQAKLLEAQKNKYNN